MGSKAGTTLADEGTRKGAPTNYFGTPSDALFSGFRRLCQAPDKIVLFYLLRACCFATRDRLNTTPRGCPVCITARVGLMSSEISSDQRTWALPIAVHDRVRRHIGQRLDR